MCNKLTRESKCASDVSSRHAIFVRCDVHNWNDQVAVFEAAISSSPEKSIDVVITNAGIIGQDDVFSMDGKLSSLLEYGL